VNPCPPSAGSLVLCAVYEAIKEGRTEMGGGSGKSAWGKWEKS